MQEKLQQGARALPPLSCGDTVVLQDLQTNNGKPGRWTKSGEVVEVLPHDAYLVRIHGSRGVTQHNRRFLRKMNPFSPAIPFTSDELSPSRVITRAIKPPPVQETPPVSQPVPMVQQPSATATVTPPTLTSPADCPPSPPARDPSPSPPAPRPLLATPSALPSADLYRRRPVGPPGANLIDLLKQQERDKQNPLRL